MIFDFNKIHKQKIESFALAKDEPYKEQIEKYLLHLSILIQDYFPLHSYVYKVTEEYPDVVIVNRIDDEDVKKYQKEELIFVNQGQKEYN